MIWDVGIVGAGAAGLMASIVAAREGAKVLLLDGKDKIGAKILMSGGTRCNLTNKIVTEKNFESENKRIVRNILQNFSSKQAISFFKEIGVDAVLEEGGKYFPSSHSGKTVLDALLKEVRTLNVTLEHPRKVLDVQFKNESFELSGAQFSRESRSVILTTGGLSYPASGSDGSGYNIAKSFGHHMIPVIPALTPLLTDDSDWKALAGITLRACLSLIVEGKKVIEFEDSFLFTHHGFSGPAVLNISRYWIRIREKVKQVELRANFLPKISEEKLHELISKSASQFPKKLIGNWLAEYLPDRLAAILIRKSNCVRTVTLNQLSKEMREQLIRSVAFADLKVCGASGFSKAEVTAGGIDLSEVDAKTLESKIRPSLFFAGEILDVDGQIGGFNFQWAWSSGFVASSNAAKKARTIA